MLVLKRQRDEWVRIGDDIWVKWRYRSGHEGQPGEVVLCFEAPDNVEILRAELTKQVSPYAR